MTATKVVPNDLRMSSREFDRIMGQALQVKPKDSEKPSGKAKKKAKKKSARK